MKRILLAGTALLALAVAQPAVAQPMPVFNWSGFYIGVNGGALGFTTDGNFPNHPNNPPFMWHTDREGTFIGGLHGGYQGQWGNFVAGIEGGFVANLSSGFGQSPGLNGATNPCGYGTGAFCQARINDILTVGLRAGFAMNQFLLYGTGGFARVLLETRGVGFPAPGIVFEPASAHHNGWYLGGGLEMMVTKNFIFGVEYRHYDFGPGINQPLDIPIDTVRVKTTADAVLLRLTIK